MKHPHSYSSLATLASCPQKFEYAYRFGLEAPSESLPQQAGTALDAAFNVLYTREWNESLALAALRESWGEDESRPRLVTSTGKHSWLTLAWLEERLRVYMREREARPTMLEEAASAGRVISEFSGVKRDFEWRTNGGEMLTLRGVPDFAVEDDRGRVWPVDTKCTTMWIGEHWMLQFRIGMQLRVYGAMLEQLEGASVFGGLINGVYIGEKALDDEKAWKKRSSVPSVLKRVDFSRQQLDEARDWALGWINVERACEESGWWPRNEKACDAYGGCEFLQLCTAPSDLMRKALMSTNFRRRERE